MCFDEISNWAKNNILVGKNTKKKIMSTKLKMILIEEFGSGMQIFMSDKKYIYRSKDDIKEFLANDNTDKYKYKTDEFDCDDYSVRLLGQFTVPGWSSAPIGIFWIKYTDKKGAHSVNIFVDDNNDVYIIEPQSDKITKASDYMIKHNAYPWVIFII